MELENIRAQGKTSSKGPRKINCGKVKQFKCG